MADLIHALKMRAEGRTWCVTVVAAWYLVFCTASCMYYASLWFRPHGAIVPISAQLLCLGAAVSAWLYFFKARLGHGLLLTLTILTLLSLGTSDPKATVFHAVVLLLLLVPLLMRRGRPVLRAGDDSCAASNPPDTERLRPGIYMTHEFKRSKLVPHPGANPANRYIRGGASAKFLRRPSHIKMGGNSGGWDGAKRWSVGRILFGFCLGF